MLDAKCPYCGADQEINHNDGYGLEENQIFEQQCSECEKNFAFTTYIHFSYETQKADCLNGQPHKLSPVKHFPKLWPDYVRCDDCGYENKGKIVPNYEEVLSGKVSS